MGLMSYFILEFCGPAAVAYQHIFTPALQQYVVDKSPEVRQAAAYGCGVLGQVGLSDSFFFYVYIKIICFH